MKAAKVLEMLLLFGVIIFVVYMVLSTFEDTATKVGSVGDAAAAGTETSMIILSMAAAALLL
jgi:hypothetical protein